MTVTKRRRNLKITDTAFRCSKVWGPYMKYCTRQYFQLGFLQCFPPDKEQKKRSITPLWMWY